MKIKQLSGLFLLSLALAGCGEQAEKRSEPEEVKTVSSVVTSSSTETSSSVVSQTSQNEERRLANEFIYAYVTQELDVSAVENRKAILLNLLSEEEIQSSILIQYLDSLKYEVASWVKEGKPNPSGGTFLQERQITSLNLYQEEHRFIAKVMYKQTTAGQASQTISNYYEFEVVDNHIQNIKVIGN